MAKLQHTFVQGKMNKDLDERLVPNGQYRDAQNVQVSTSESSDVGAVENILGNTVRNLRSTSPNAFWQTGFGLTNPVCIGVVKDSQNEKIYWFLSAPESSTDAIVEFNQVTGIVAPILVDVNGVLNFNKLDLITGVNILEGLLYWTDDRNEPRVINIATFKAGSTTFAAQTHVYGATRDFVASDITVITPRPLTALTSTAFPSIYSGPGTGVTPILTASPAAAWSNFGIGDTVGISWTEQITWTGLSNPKVIISQQISGDNGKVENYEIIGTLSNLGTISAIITIQSITPNIPGTIIDFNMLLVEDEPIFKNDFPRFSYRYKFVDGRFSTYAPFSQATFAPGKFEYASRDGFNIGMEDVIRKISLTNFPSLTAADFPRNVVEIEVLYKSSQSTNIYLIESFGYVFSANLQPVLTLDITSDTLGPVIESVQLLRLFDNVPQKAKSQELIGNRIVYGNYLQNYDVPNSSISVQVNQINTNHTNPLFGKASVKTDRKYQIGISFLDGLGRESPVFTSASGSISLQKENSNKENQIQVKISASSVPSWASAFKAYIKNNTPEYYNIALDRYYNSIDGNVWLSFPSSERNKVQEGQFIILKKEHNNDLPVQVNNRYKINSISNEAPDSLTKVQTAAARANVLGFSALDTPRGFVVGNNRIRFYGPNSNVIEDGSDITGTNTNFHQNITQGNYISFSNSTGGGTSLTYEIAYGGPTGALLGPITGVTYSVYEIVLVKNIDPVDSWLTVTFNALFRSTVYINENRVLPEFTGRFFVKINPNGTFINSVEAAFSDLAVPLIEDGNITITTTLGTNLSGNQTLAAWQDALDPNNPNFLLPTAGSASFNLALARTEQLPLKFGGGASGTGSYFPEVAYQYYQNLLQGSRFKFLYADTTLSENDYIVFNVDSSGDFGGYPRGGSNGSGRNQKYTLNRNFDDTQYGGTPTAAQIVGIVLYTEQTTTTEVIQSSKNPAIFETESDELLDIDLYYEASNSIPISDITAYNTLNWFNCYSFGNGVESDRIRDDFNMPVVGKGVRVSSTLEEPYRQERLGSSMIFSGIFNSISSVNNTNQFLTAENITKTLNPTYGTIQKLHARDTDLVVLLEDKCFRVLANKDALYNANGSTNITASNNVLGQAVPFVGEYGISKNPESFASFGFRTYFTDKARGAVLRLSRDGLTDISDKGMSSFFQDGLRTNVNPSIIGSYDTVASSYNIVIGGEGVSFKEGVDGWNTKMSYNPEAGISLNNEYYTFKRAELYKHTLLNDYVSPPAAVPRSNFYGVQGNTTVTAIFNDAPTSIKNFKTLSYEGDAGWAASVVTNAQSGTVSTWKEREGIYFNYIMGDGTFFRAELNGAITSSSTIVISAPNANISVGDTVTGAGILNVVRVTNIAADKITITISSAQTLANGTKLTFTNVADVDTKEFSVQGIGKVLAPTTGSTIEINGDINVSLQSNDVIYHAVSSTELRTIGTVLSVDRINNHIRLDANVPGAPLVANNFVLFAKNSQVNTSGLLGYQATVKMTTNSGTKKELFAVNSEVFISSE